MAGAMAWVVLGWLCAALVLWGLGAAGGRLLRLPGSLRGDGFIVFWVGWALALALLQLWHCFLPVDGRASLVLAALGAAGAVWNRQKLRTTLGRWVRGRRLFVAVSALAVVALAHLALRAPRNGDTGAYFLATVRWLSAHPVVPGLGNLFDRLAFNQSYFLYVAALQVGPFEHRAHALANSLLLVMLFGRGLSGTFQLSRVPPRARAQPLFALLSLPFVVDLVLGSNFTSPTPDIAISCLGYVASEGLLRLWSSGGRAPRTERAWGLCLALLCAVGLTVKLSWVGFGLPCYALTLGVVWSRARARREVVRASLVHMGVLGACVLAPWMALNVITSGYPAYPSALAGLPVDWRIPRETVENLTAYIRAWGRRPGAPLDEVLANQAWVGPWANSLLLLNMEVLLPVGLWLASLVALVWRKPGSAALLFAPPLLGLGFWFLSSPDPRFAGACFWLLPVIGWVLVLRAPAARESEFTLARVLVLSFTGVMLLLSPPGWQPGGFEPLPPPQTHAFRTDWGLELQVGSCWDAPPPCSEIANRHLRWREEGQPSRGFRVETHPGAPERAEHFRAYR